MNRNNNTYSMAVTLVLLFSGTLLAALAYRNFKFELSSLHLTGWLCFVGAVLMYGELLQVWCHLDGCLGSIATYIFVSAVLGQLTGAWTWLPLLTP
jgi:hypothetical protein